MKNMKKVLAALLALTMTVCLASCGETGGAGNDGGTVENSVTEEKKEESKTEETEAPEETEPAETEAPAPAVPDGYEEVKLESDYLGVNVSFAALNDGRFVGSEIKPNKSMDQYGRSEFEVNYYSDEKHKLQDCVKYKVTIQAISNDAMVTESKRYKAIENSEYSGYWSTEIEDKTKCYYKLFTDENTYINGRIMISVDMWSYGEWMPLDDYKKMTNTMIESMKIDILDTNSLNDANGDFPNCHGTYTVPAKMNIAGKDCDTYWYVKNGQVHAAVDFTNEKGNTFTILDNGPNVPQYFSSHVNSETLRQLQFGDKNVLADINIGTVLLNSALEAEYTVVFETDGEKEKSISFSILMGGSGDFNYLDFKNEYGDEEKKAEWDAMLDSYAEEYFNQIIYNSNTANEGTAEDESSESSEAAEETKAEE
jgi:hypothetical protein